MGNHDPTPEDREKAGRKPMPKTTRAWMAEIEGVQTFVKKRVELRDAQGKAWLDSMKAYYRSRLRLLAAHPPAALPPPAVRAIVREVLKALD